MVTIKRPGQCRHCRDDTNARCRGGDYRGEWHRVMLRYLLGVFQRGLGRTAIRLGNQQLVFVNDVVETGSFQCKRHVDKELAVPWRAAMGEGRIPVPRGEIGEPSEVKSLCQADLLSDAIVKMQRGNHTLLTVLARTGPTRFGILFARPQ